MRMPVLESVISGECYADVPWEHRVDFDFYLCRVDPSDFDFKNPFDFDCSALFANLRYREEGEDVAKREIPISYSDTDFENDENNERYGIFRELELLCNQLYYLENDYYEKGIDDNDVTIIEIIAIETFECLLQYLDGYNRYKGIKQSLGKFVVDFYSAYHNELKGWNFLNNRNRRLIKTLVDKYGDVMDYVYLSEDYEGKKENKSAKTDKSQVVAEDKITEARRKLKFLDGEYKGERFMSDGDFDKLTRWVEVMIKDRRIEEDVEPIVLRKRKDTKRAWNKDFLKCALREVHDVVYEHKNEFWIEFMASVLGQKVNTIKSKFRDTPKDYDEVKQAVTSGV